MDPVGWVTLEEAHERWPDAAGIAESLLFDLLLAAYEQCMAYGNISEADPDNPRHRIAQVMQARALYRANMSGDNNGAGPEGFQITIFPMDWTVKNLLRPKRAVPVIF